MQSLLRRYADRHRVQNEIAALREANPCHTPAGSPQGGQFCSTADRGGAGGPGQPKGGWKSPGEQAAAEGRISYARPAAFKAALERNTRADTLSTYDETTLETFTLRMLDGGQAGYAIKPDGEFVNLFNSGGAATKGAGPWLVIDAIEHGAAHGDHFDGFLTGFYRRLGWKEERREANWTPGGPDVVYMRWAGGDRTTARQRYQRDGRIDLVE